ncbi:type VI secretion system tube protein TssD [Nannocystis sp. SCPEA4]|uniref:type VI secretion system tube protein TssD n=1 Tax=Nannocystis sp. SCPEA4 TaxID=2996787 RepID=UPI00226EC7BF|nr:type VI secretion system tube protein TssD [Nannocystis sp. SCPEA4]MCY1060202.1 type VI secretion system tube protein TssD [Nannocystis sp. SCPEA4]
MAENVYVKITANGKQLEGESTVKSKGREGLIECRQIHMGARTGIDRTGGKGTGSVLFDDFVLIKPIDKASALIYQALCQNETIEIEAKFFRPSQADGKTEHFYSIIGTGGRIISISQSTADGMDPNSANEEPCETISLKFEAINFSYPTASLEYGYSRSNSDW